jgi:alpha(1,3/1,4) fucosyltransferase
MKPQIRVAFAFFWPGFVPDKFRSYFPYVYDKYDLVVSQTPEVVFHSVFAPGWKPYGNPDDAKNVPRVKPGNYVRVFLTGENLEPLMEHCEYAISFSALIDHPNHLRLPLWVYENRGSGYRPEHLIKDPDTDWDRVVAQKTEFCNFVYLHPVPFRERIFQAVSAYRKVDAAGTCLNNMNGWIVPSVPSRLAGKIEFFRRYKFTLAIENSIWPGYETEKLVDPLYAGSIPIYAGNPMAPAQYDTSGYIDLANFSSLKEMMDFIRQIDNDKTLYRNMLQAPFYRDNRVPELVKDETVLAFFDRIFQTAIARRVMGARGAATGMG